MSGEIFLCDMPMDGPAGGPPESRGPRAAAALVVVEGPDPGGVLPLRRGVYSLGRGDVDFHINDPRLSRLHAVIRVSRTSIVPATRAPPTAVVRRGTDP